MVTQAAELCRLVHAFRGRDAALDSRLARGARLLLLAHVSRLYDGIWLVASEH
jgi:hypothetical protein